MARKGEGRSFLAADHSILGEEQDKMIVRVESWSHSEAKQKDPRERGCTPSSFLYCFNSPISGDVFAEE